MCRAAIRDVKEADDVDVGSLADTAHFWSAKATWVETGDEPGCCYDLVRVGLDLVTSCCYLETQFLTHRPKT